MNCPQCQAALEPGMEQCPSCKAQFNAPVAEGQPPLIALEKAEPLTTTTATEPSLVVQQVTNVTGIPANLVPRWRLLKPVAAVVMLAPAGLLILFGLLATGEVYKKERSGEFFQPLAQDEKIKLAAAAAAVQTVLFVVILSI